MFRSRRENCYRPLDTIQASTILRGGRRIGCPLSLLLEQPHQPASLIRTNLSHERLCRFEGIQRNHPVTDARAATERCGAWLPAPLLSAALSALPPRLLDRLVCAELLRRDVQAELLLDERRAFSRRL